VRTRSRDVRFLSLAEFLKALHCIEAEVETLRIVLPSGELLLSPVHQQLNYVFHLSRNLTSLLSLAKVIIPYFLGQTGDQSALNVPYFAVREQRSC
jgi:hypothetical protein